MVKSKKSEEKSHMESLQQAHPQTWHKMPESETARSRSTGAGIRLREVLVKEYENKEATKRRNIAVHAKEPSCPEEPGAGKPHAGICEGGAE